MSQKTPQPGRLEVINPKSREPIQPPRLLAHIEQHAAASYEQLLTHMFSATDDLFYDLSKRASSNNEQNLYFEAMREIRIKREGILQSFLRQLAADFLALINLQRDELHQGEPATLSLVEGDDLEIELARNNMVSRTRDAYKEELYELSMRLDHLLLQTEIHDNNNPLDPQQVTAAFIEACQTQLDVNIKAKLILYKLFEKHVLKQLGHIYADANQTLMETGILPKVPRNLGKSSASRAGDSSSTHDMEVAQARQADEPGMPVPLFRMNPEAVSALMAAVRRQVATAAGNTVNATNINCYFYTKNPGPVMALPELTNLLTQQQPSVAARLYQSAPRNVVVDVISQLLAQRNPQTPQSLKQSEEDVINLVAIFFDQILQDENLPLAVQSLICRLQIPILKVALKEPTFFNDPEHPARKLINTLTEAGLGFEESRPLEKDPLYRKITDIIENINRHYQTDDRIFAIMQTELDLLVQREQRKSSIVEQRTQQTEAGKSRIKQARIAAQNMLYQKLKEHPLPEAVSQFLTTSWLQVLIISYLKHGLDSNEWVVNEQTVTDLIWLCQPHNDVRSQQRRERLQPELLDRIETGLEVAIDSPDVRAGKVAALEDVLKAICDHPSVPGHYQPLNEDQKQALGRGEDAEKSWNEMTAVERQQARYEELAGDFYEEAKNIRPGSWVEYLDETDDKPIRCKLAAKIDADTYIFVNRLGLKVLEKSRKQFAYDMQFKRARVLDATPLFDRIMGKVVTHAQKAS